MLARSARRYAVALSLFLPRGCPGNVSRSAKDIQSRKVKDGRSSQEKYSTGLCLVDAGVRWGFKMHGSGRG